ncbi:Na(+)-translocating NADH-quinone reductase subunit C [Moraxella pluranimalium]|uniref:Na(+)-translocating NADH-quinone reductase subunit C n=1 Tax=Moraxella pluranimalium TaxID=470453 RepID=A0A1T0CM50_9GAMM|nr:Na(+)-translocating NADH-quinone reductase subunit C [Moraxella pluranimalium]OOS23395.1 Na(+)-translocating NADH-quinone reductase subunit C [Moraxella pluranimalium]
MSAKNSNISTMATALILCLVCSVMVSAAAISLKPKQTANIEIDRNKNILMAANMFDPAKNTNADAQKLFENVEIKLVDTKTGQFATDEQLSAAGISDVGAYDATKASKDPKTNIDLGSDDPAQIGALPQFLKVYLIKDEGGQLKNIVLPINGNGLWGQIYGFLTLKSDLNTIEGISFYQHKETPGLGALIETPKWRATWTDKQAYDEQGNITTGVVKSGSPKPNPNYVDGITGATITSSGVNHMVQFWLSDRAYKPFLDNLRSAKEQ